MASIPLDKIKVDDIVVNFTSGEFVVYGKVLFSRIEDGCLCIEQQPFEGKQKLVYIPLTSMRDWTEFREE